MDRSSERELVRWIVEAFATRRGRTDELTTARSIPEASPRSPEAFCGALKSFGTSRRGRRSGKVNETIRDALFGASMDRIGSRDAPKVEMSAR